RWTDTAAIRAPANARPAATCGRRCVARRVHRCQPGVCIAEGPQERAGHGFVRCGAVLGTTAHITIARGQPLTEPPVRPPRQERGRTRTKIASGITDSSAPPVVSW